MVVVVSWMMGNSRQQLIDPCPTQDKEPLRECSEEDNLEEKKEDSEQEKKVYV